MKKETTARELLAALVLSTSALALPVGVHAQVNPEIANCSELKDEATITQADLCSAHIGCRFVLNVQKTCARAKSYLERLQTAIGEGTKTLFGYRKEVTPDAIFTAELNSEERSNERALGARPDVQPRAQDIGNRVRDAGTGDTLSGNGKNGTTWVYYGQTRDGQEEGAGTTIFSSGEIQRGQYRQGERQGAFDVLHPNGDRFVGDYVNGKRVGAGAYGFKNGATLAGRWTDTGAVQGTFTRADGSRFEGLRVDGKPAQGREYRADGSLSEEGHYDKGVLSVGARIDTEGNRIDVNLPRDREAAARAEAEKSRLAAEAEQQRKREQAAQAEQQFRASLQTMNPGQLFAKADELNAQGDRSRARDVQRVLMSRFPDHPLATTVARQMTGESGGGASTGGSSASTGTSATASRPASGRLPAQTCDVMKQAVMTTRVPPNASITASQETVMFLTKTVLEMIAGGCPTDGTTPAQIEAERQERQRQYTAAESACNAVQSGGRRCVPRAHSSVTSSAAAPRAQQTPVKDPYQYDPVTGLCGGYSCRCVPGGPGVGSEDCSNSGRSSGGGIRTAR
ncbi:hypothetical protein J2W25_001952 [Variovorax boronicumulans]|uniref:MORN repeat-containing protein n=1 Tax=Variovorax boronicumulans TaxID=436515 RepID=A0AAW8DTL1_9BURK|nr:hypothetical protein [Variovorax boronicumulans]MDP9877646.1 hypothetical protein [Variovorax boronicumulans]MDP9922931.1 hypothetical protein [Variovorax boronicumulans]